jgi:hypothetical protein
MTIARKLEKKINSIILLTGKMPEEIEITQNEYDELAIEAQRQVNIVEVLDKDRQPLNKFMGVKLKIKN